MLYLQRNLTKEAQHINEIGEGLLWDRQKVCVPPQWLSLMKEGLLVLSAASSMGAAALGAVPGTLCARKIPCSEKIMCQHFLCILQTRELAGGWRRTVLGLARPAPAPFSLSC